MTNRYIQHIYSSHLQTAENYRRWAKVAPSDEQRVIMNRLEATALALAENMDLLGLPKDGKVPISANKRRLASVVSQKTSRKVYLPALESAIMEVRDDVQLIDSRFQGYLFHR